MPHNGSGGFTGAVARLFRSFHRGAKHSEPSATADDFFFSSSSSYSSASSSSVAAASVFLLLAGGAGRSPPKTTRLPSGFLRQVRHLVDYVTLLAKQRGTAGTSTRRHAAVAKTLDRLALLLRERDDNDSATRNVPLNAALEQLLAVWECVLQCLDLSRAAGSHGSTGSSPLDRLSTCSSTSSGAMDDATRLEIAARTLLSLLLQQREFDFALMALGRGECNVHQSDGMRKKSIHDGSSSSRGDELRVSMRNSRRGSVTSKRPPLPRPMPSKRDVSSTSDAPLCQLAKKYLDLHQTTLRLLQDAHSAAVDRFEHSDGRDKTSDRALLMQLLSVSYVRVPALRDAILTAFQQSMQASNGRRRRLLARQQRFRAATSAGAASSSSSSVHGTVRSRSVTLLDEVNVALFRWTNSLHPKCHGGVAPYNRDGFWAKESRQIAVELQNKKFQRVFVAYLIDHFLTVGGSGGTDWKCLPGASTLKEVVLTMTETVFQAQLRAAELTLMEKQDASTGNPEGSSLKGENEELGRQSFSLSTPDDWTVGLFLKQSMRMLACNTLFIHDWMMTIFHNTNYMVSYHVTLCLRYLGQLMTEFPAYFAADYTTMATGAVDETVLRQVFTQLLKSDHYEILRNTEMFLMKHFAGFSVTLRESLVEVFAAEFKRLFLHWNRDVRFCFYHMMLYLTFPGNRLVLGAKSDELLMGAAAAYLFEIPGLMRNNSSSPKGAKWDAFDVPLCELIAHVNRTTKQTKSPPSSAAKAAQQQRAAPSSSTTTRASMTLRPKPAARASLSTRSSANSRMSLTAAPLSARASLSSYASASTLMPKCASMSSLPVGPASAPAALVVPPPVPAWIQALAFSTVQRSVQEYRRHVEVYFSFARQISVHDAVPTPLLEAATK